MELGDEVLARRWRRGDAQAAAAVVARYTDALGAVAYGILGDVSLAEDVVQETFARAAKGIRTLEDPARLGRWLVGIARHAAVDTVRKRRRERPLGRQDVPSPHGNPGREAARAELRTLLREAVTALPEDQRDLFVMKYTAGMSYREIGRVLAMSPDAVGQKLWRIRQKLQHKLEDLRP